MDGRLFTFAGLISHNHDFIIAFHTILIAIIAVVLAKLATSRMQIVPGAIQNVFEVFLGGVIFMAKDVIGEEKARKYLPLTATIAFFVFLANAIGIIPGFEAPSSSLSFTLTLAAGLTFLRSKMSCARSSMEYMSWWGGGEMSEMPGIEWRVRAMILSTLNPGSWPPSPGLAPCATLICISSALTRYSVVTPKRPDATCLLAERADEPSGRWAKRSGSSPPSPVLLRAPMAFMAMPSAS